MMVDGRGDGAAVRKGFHAAEQSAMVESVEDWRDNNMLGTT